MIRMPRIILFVAVFIGMVVRPPTHVRADVPSTIDTKTSVTPSLHHEVLHSVPPPRDEDPVQKLQTDDYWRKVPNECERFAIVEGTRMERSRRGFTYPKAFRRVRDERSPQDWERTRALIRLVAREMGADANAARLLEMMALHESEGQPGTLHLLNSDQAAHRRAYIRHTYSPEREAKLIAAISTTSPRSERYWKLKRSLAAVRKYKVNSHWTATLPYDHIVPARGSGLNATPATTTEGQHNAWAVGYGLFGMNAVLYTSVLSPEAPPWVLCADGGIPAIVTAVWALREQQDQCRAASRRDAAAYGDDGGSVRALVRRWGTGHCGEGMPGAEWRGLLAQQQRRAKSFGWQTVPRFGTKHGRYTSDAQGRRVPTDRVALLSYLKRRAGEEGLLPPTSPEVPSAS